MKGIHTDDVSAPILIVVTVNDYLAQRDAEWMGRVHHFLGLSVGLIQVIYNIEAPAFTYAGIGAGDDSHKCELCGFQFLCFACMSREE